MPRFFVMPSLHGPETPEFFLFLILPGLDQICKNPYAKLVGAEKFFEEVVILHLVFFLGIYKTFQTVFIIFSSAGGVDLVHPNFLISLAGYLTLAYFLLRFFSTP